MRILNGTRRREHVTRSVPLSPNFSLFFLLLPSEMDARGIAKVSRVVPGPKLSIGLFASARFPFCWMKVDLARRMKNL